MADDATHATVIAIRLVDFDAQPVAAQAAMRERLEGVVARAITGFDAADRVVLDAAEGAVLVFLRDLAAVVDAAGTALSAAHAAGLEAALGLNVGPVKSADHGGRPNLIGDGIATALGTARFAAPGEILASRTFRDAAATESPDLADRFVPAGERTDASLRLHELYRCSPADGRSSPRRRRVLRTLAVSAVLLLGSGIGARVAREAAAQRRKPARVALAITPWAEVSVDGVGKGRTPPLQALELAPGRHTIAIRHGKAAPLTLDLDLKPGEETTVRHAFTAPQQQARPRAAQPLSERVRSFLKGLGQ